jgi:hypothetical protein
MNKPTTIKIDDIEYVRKDVTESPAPTLDGKKYVIVRTFSAGVFAGYLDSRNGQEVVLLKARRLWQFFAASLSELAQSGTPDTSKCKFPEEVDRVELLQAIEILDVTEKAKKSIDSVKVWRA